MKQRLLLIAFLPFIFLLYAVISVYFIVAIVFNTERAVSIALACDRLGNASMGQGDKETISSWSGRKNSWQEKFIDWLFYHLTGELNHCDNNRENFK